MSVLSNTGIRAGASAAGGDTTKYVEEVFSIDLYDGTGNEIDIDNGVDINGEGGMVWVKSRNTAYGQFMFDTERGATKVLNAAETSSESTEAAGVTSFNSDGFTVGSDGVNDGAFNHDTTNYVGWTFRKAPGFFDVVTWTGNGVSGRTIEHNLGCVPGCIMVKCLTHAEHWAVYHKSTGATHGLKLDHTDTPADESFFWNDTAPTKTHFSLGNSGRVNESGGTRTYVAYLFADGDDTDAQIWGDDEDEAIIKIGSYEGDGSSNNEVDLGFEPQYVIIRDIDSAQQWIQFDSMRGLSGYLTSVFHPSDTDAEQDSSSKWEVTPNGFRALSSSSWCNTDGNTYVYIAIRRGLMKTPTDATKVFAMDTYGGTAPSPPTYTAGFPPDMEISFRTDTTDEDKYTSSRKLTGYYFFTNEYNGRQEDSAKVWDYQNGLGSATGTSSIYQSCMFRRARGFFDVVGIYMGNGSGRTLPHDLGVVPEMIFTKCITNSQHWAIYHKDFGVDTATAAHAKFGRWNHNSGTSYGSTTMWNNTAPTASVFSVGANDESNKTGEEMIAYLFASCPGVSKVGYYTGTGSDINVDCGFTSGARFVMIKREDEDGDYFLWDSTRGIVAGNEPYARMNVDAAQTGGIDYIDPYNAGFTITAAAAGSDQINDSDTGARYLFLAIA